MLYPRGHQNPAVFPNVDQYIYSNHLVINFKLRDYFGSNVDESLIICYHINIRKQQTFDTWA